MKNWLKVLLIAFVIVLSCVYLFIPNSISLHRMLTIEANSTASFRTLLDGAAWEKWWPGIKKLKNGRPRLFYNGFFYTVIDQKTNALVIAIADEEMQATTVLNFFSDNHGEIVFLWEGVVTATLIPTARVQNYFIARAIQKDMGVILKRMGNYFSKPDHLYSVPISEEQVMDSILISTYAESKGYPSTDFIYTLVDQLKQYASNQSAKETGFPMLNIYTSDSLLYVTRVALPVDKKLPASGKISYKWMLGGGKILVTEVKGGTGAIDLAMKQIEYYIYDNKLVAPAIPFQSLITDRSQVRDTNLWITKIYYPVM